MNVVVLPAIKETTQDYEALEKAIRDFFKKEIYLPILREFDDRAKATLSNAKVPGLREALLLGRVTFHRGVFSGKFNSEISRDLQELGAKFSRSKGVWYLPASELPVDVRSAVAASEQRFQEKLDRIDKKLGDVLADELAGRGISKKLKTAHFFDRALWKVEKQFQANVRNITIAPNLTPEQRKRIAAEWGENMQLWIKDFTEKEIKDLRVQMAGTIFSGNRYGSAVMAIQDSYGVTQKKAKFLARQETSLLMTKFKQTRYQAAGVEYYRWGCVAGSPHHPVRPWHRKLEGKVFKWSEPPNTAEPGTAPRYCNPGQDYNCRCFARPLVGYKPKA